jgi:segregation and condensation protein B
MSDDQRTDDPQTPEPAPPATDTAGDEEEFGAAPASADSATDSDAPAVDAEGPQAEQPVAGAERNSETMSILEAAVFASTDILTPQRLKSILPGQPDGRVIRNLVQTINQKLQRERHPFEIAEIGGGYQFRTVPYYHPWVQQVFREKAARRLSIQALECLAIIAYRQPITKAEIEAIRGVVSDGAMKTLLEKRLVTIVGRSEKPGRPLLYGTAPLFIQYFGLNKIADLPRIEEFEAMARDKMESLSEEELQRIEQMAGAGEPAEAAVTEDADGAVVGQIEVAADGAAESGEGVAPETPSADDDPAQPPA